MTELFVFYQDGSNDQTIQYISANEPDQGLLLSFSSPITIPSTLLWDSPSVCNFNNELYVHHQSCGGSNELYFNTATDNENILTWYGDQCINGPLMSCSPSSVVFNDSLYVFFQAQPDTNGTLWFTSTDGLNNWITNIQVPSTNLIESPSACAFNDLLFVFYQGLSNGTLWCNTFDGENWQGNASIPNVAIGQSPSAVVFNNSIFVFYQLANSTELWYVVSSDGVNWSESFQVPGTFLTCSPSATVMGDALYVFHQDGSEEGSLWYNCTSNGFNWVGDQQVVGISMSDSPCALQV